MSVGAWLCAPAASDNYIEGMGIVGPALSATRLAIALVALAVSSWSQTVEAPHQPTQATAPKQTKIEQNNNPLPDIPTLMHAVEINQRNAEAVQKNYLYHSVESLQQMDGHGSIKKTSTSEYDDFWVTGVPVRRLLRKDGKDLTPEQQKKESERIDKEAARSQEKRRKADAAGKETDPRGNEEITVSRLLELGHFTNPRRVTINERDTIAVDYSGDPKAKTRNRSEDVIRDLIGTVWVDEQDQTISRIEGHFLNAFKVGGGLLMNIRKDTSFALVLKKVNDEVWLPAQLCGQGAARALLFFNFDGRIHVEYSDYRKFKATSTILPGLRTVEEQATPETPNREKK